MPRLCLGTRDLPLATCTEDRTMSERNLRIRLGIFVVVALMLLGLLILLFGSLPPLFRTANTYTVIFDDAPGINQGSPVRRSGVRIGEVADVVLDDENNKVRV